GDLVDRRLRQLGELLVGVARVAVGDVVRGLVHLRRERVGELVVELHGGDQLVQLGQLCRGTLDEDVERLRRRVARCVLRAAGHGRVPDRECRAGGGKARDGVGAVDGVGCRRGEGDDGAAGGGRVDGEPRGYLKRRRRRVADADGEAGAGAVAGGVAGGAGDGRGAEREDGTGCRQARDGDRAVDHVGRGRCAVADGGAGGTGCLDGDVRVRADRGWRRVADGDGEGGAGGVAGAVAGGAGDGGGAEREDAAGGGEARGRDTAGDHVGRGGCAVADGGAGGTGCLAGGVVSRTETVKVEVAELPAASCAEQVTTVSPSGNWLPEAGTQETATEPSRLSLAVGEA